jgi:hypothetical protein
MNAEGSEMTTNFVNRAVRGLTRMIGNHCSSEE